MAALNTRGDAPETGDPDGEEDKDEYKEHDSIREQRAKMAEQRAKMAEKRRDETRPPVPTAKPPAPTPKRLEKVPKSSDLKEKERKEDEASVLEFSKQLGVAIENQKKDVPGANAEVEKALHESGNADVRKGLILGVPHNWERYSDEEYGVLTREVAGTLFPSKNVKGRLPYLELQFNHYYKLRGQASVLLDGYIEKLREAADGNTSAESQEKIEEAIRQLSDEKITLGQVLTRIQNDIEAIRGNEKGDELPPEALASKGEERVEDLLVGPEPPSDQPAKDAIVDDLSKAAKISRWMRRNWLGVTGLAATIIALIVGITTATRKATIKASESARSAAGSAGLLSPFLKGSASIVSWSGSNLWAIPVLIAIIYVSSRAGKKGRRRW